MSQLDRTDDEPNKPIINQKIRDIVFGFVRNAQHNLLPLIESSDESTFDAEDIANDIENDVTGGEITVITTISRSSSSSTLSQETKQYFNNNTNKISDIILIYYYDKLLIDTSILYNSWYDLNNIISTDNISEIQLFYNKLIELGYDKYRLPIYEMVRYYLGVCGDMNRALNKWKGSIETYSYYKLNEISCKEIKECVQILSKSCHFCGYSNKSPVFVLNYEKFNWNEFNDTSHIIKAAFYVCAWMTDNIDAINNGITLMINSRGIRFHHIKRAMTLLRAMQKSLALRTNHVFFCNLPSLAKNSMKLFLKIYPKHIQEKIHICSNTDSLFNILNQNEIPQVFGGALNNKQSLSLGEILSNYMDIKSFKYFHYDSD